jgi:hypothetical protein
LANNERFRVFKGMNSSLTGHGGEIFEELSQSFSTLQTIQDGLERNSRTTENGRSAEEIWVPGNYIAR